MPRKSAEDIAGAYYRTEGKPPVAPEHLSPQAKKLWREITSSRPPDYFTAGATQLLEAFCQTTEMHRFYMSVWAHDRTNVDYVKAIATLNASLSTLATKLRLALTSVDRRAGILTEKGDVAADGAPLYGSNITKFEKRDVLFGGGKVQF
jgi:phage terminase small subunit